MPRASSSSQLWAFALLRLLLGINFFGHGLIRILHGTARFAAGMVQQMASTPLPEPLVNAFGHVLPFAEFTLGSLLILGLFTRLTLAAGLFLLCALMLGVTLHQDWMVAGDQLIYGIVFAALLAFADTHSRPWSALLLRRGAR